MQLSNSCQLRLDIYEMKKGGTLQSSRQSLSFCETKCFHLWDANSRFLYLLFLLKQVCSSLPESLDIVETETGFQPTTQLFPLKQDEKGISLLKCGLSSLQFPGLSV